MLLQLDLYSLPRIRLCRQRLWTKGVAYADYAVNCLEKLVELFLRLGRASSGPLILVLTPEVGTRFFLFQLLLRE